MYLQKINVFLDTQLTIDQDLFDNKLKNVFHLLDA